MPNLIEELICEHKILLDMLDEIKASDISSKAGQEKLLALRDLLLSHVRKEDEQYYPAFRRAAEDNRVFKITLDYFVSDMEAVSERAMHVFSKYSLGGDDAEFAGDFKLLHMMLKDRIHAEEKTLFVKFNPFGDPD